MNSVYVLYNESPPPLPYPYSPILDKLTVPVMVPTLPFETNWQCLLWSLLSHLRQTYSACYDPYSPILQCILISLLSYFRQTLRACYAPLLSYFRETYSVVPCSLILDKLTVHVMLPCSLISEELTVLFPAPLGCLYSLYRVFLYTTIFKGISQVCHEGGIEWL